MLCMENKRSGRKSQAVTPVVATMILLSGTIILALVVGIFTFGFLGSGADTVTLSSGTLASGVTSDNTTISSTSSLVFYLKNPGRALNVTGLTLSGSALTSSISAWSITPYSQQGNSFLTAGHNSLPGGRTTSFTIYPVQVPSTAILFGETYTYYIVLSNGQSISGELIAQ
jgi:FlaG/FlaF family flagellin (archaellin)